MGGVSFPLSSRRVKPPPPGGGGATIRAYGHFQIEALLALPTEGKRVKKEADISYAERFASNAFFLFFTNTDSCQKAACVR